MDHEQGHPVLLEFWDFCRPNSIRTLPYVRAWHARYTDHGLRVIGVHSAGFEPSREPDAVRAAVARLEIDHPVVVDSELEIWRLYGNLGWPARYLFDEHGMLFERHFGEGAYDETERAIQELLEIESPLVEPVRPEDVPGALLEPQSEDVPGPYSGPYRAGGVWAVLEGEGTVSANERKLAVSAPGCYELVSHPRSTEGTLALELGPGVTCHAVCFTPGLA
jgi:AhpC/TSA family